MEIEVSIGEIVDKLSILQIKKENITDETKLENVNKEFLYLLILAASPNPIPGFNILAKNLEIGFDEFEIKS